MLPPSAPHTFTSGIRYAPDPESTPTSRELDQQYRIYLDLQAGIYIMWNQFQV